MFVGWRDEGMSDHLLPALETHMSFRRLKTKFVKPLCHSSPLTSWWVHILCLFLLVPSLVSLLCPFVTLMACQLLEAWHKWCNRKVSAPREGLGPLRVPEGRRRFLKLFLRTQSVCQETTFSISSNPRKAWHASVVSHQECWIPFWTPPRSCWEWANSGWRAFYEKLRRGLGLCVEGWKKWAPLSLPLHWQVSISECNLGKVPWVFEGAVIRTLIPLPFLPQ